MHCEEHAADVCGAGAPRLARQSEEAKIQTTTRWRRSTRWQFIAGGSVVLAASLFVAWHAGRESEGLEGQRLSAEVNRVAQKLSATEWDLEQQRLKADQLEKALRTQGKAANFKQQVQTRQELLKAQAEANEYKQLLARQEDSVTKKDPLIGLLSEPGVKLIQLQANEAAAGSTAYALVVEDERLIFVASNLPPSEAGKTYQLWLLRNHSSEIVSAGQFRPNDSKRVVLEFAGGSVVDDISGLEVTEEPESGTTSPTGAKIFESVQSPQAAESPNKRPT